MVGGDGMKHRAATVCIDQRPVGAALTLNGQVTSEFVLVPFHGGTMDGPQVAVVTDVVDDLLGVLIQGAEVVVPAAYPVRTVPLLQTRSFPLGLATLGVMPDPDGAQAFHHRPGLDAGGLRNGALVVRDVIALAVGPESPGVVGAANAVALDIV